MINTDCESKQRAVKEIKQQDYTTQGNQLNQNQSFAPNLDTSSQLQQQQQQTCTCGFSAIVNRQILANKAKVMSLNRFLKSYKSKLQQAQLSQYSPDSLMPYLKLVELMQSNFGVKNSLSNQLIVLDSNDCNGLFFEDYIECLNLNVPHSLLRQCLKINEQFKSEQKTKNFLLNSILIRQNYRWKKSFTFQPIHQKSASSQQNSSEANIKVTHQTNKVNVLNNLFYFF